jgi:hypothetical protein
MSQNLSPAKIHYLYSSFFAAFFLRFGHITTKNGLSMKKQERKEKTEVAEYKRKEAEDFLVDQLAEVLVEILLDEENEKSPDKH